ncbi:MAG: phage/plasmid primase, P4 family [Nitrosarchaeum sp.]|uniref:DNA primase family protein n=1 Tax=Nitrosarchaeum sp. TaxID=2026886 RepID=UPI002DF1B81B|nr:phage/plasmid primase, P4 family [Nitrosarchaeum sp.]MEC4849112.1 phage/plasmid primase, P4 family [Nitrosarchaeum sp.]
MEKNEYICKTCKAGPWNEYAIGSNGLYIVKAHRDLGHDIIEYQEFEEIKFERTVWDDEDRQIFKLMSKYGDKELSYLDYAKIIQEICKIKTLEDTQECLFYENGIYNSNAEIKIKRLLLKLNPELKLHEITEIIGKIKQMSGIKRDEFDNTHHKICLKNCIVDVKTRQTEPHDPEKYYRIQIPVTYDPKAKCPKFSNFVNTCITSSDERIMLIEQMSTPLLGNLPKLEAMYFNVGDGDNGKSTFFEMIGWVYGSNNISTVSFHDLVTNRFAKARLEGKLLNIFPDIGSDALDNLNPIKPIISGDPIDAEYKYQNPHTFVNRAKMFFSANELPEIKEKTFADFKRIRVIKWIQRFLKPNEYSIKFHELKAKLGDAFTDSDIENELASSGIHKMNKQFVKSIIDNETEKSGIFNLLLVCASKIIQRDGFFIERSIDDIREAWSKNSTALESFIKDCLITCEGEISRHEAYFTYYNYCKALGKPALPNNSFQRELQALIPSLDPDGWRGKTRVYRGISWNKNNEIVKRYVSTTSTTDKQQNLSPKNSKIDEKYE